MTPCAVDDIIIVGPCLTNLTSLFIFLDKLYKLKDLGLLK